ncbi:MAG: c-type cytochrome [Myxococcota bacterium]
MRCRPFPSSRPVRSPDASAARAARRADAGPRRAHGPRTAIGLLLSASLGLALSGCGASESPAARFARDPDSLKRGRSLFVGTCAAYCHGLQPGVRDAPYLFDCDWKHGGSDEEIFATIRAGVPETRMQGFADRMPEGDDDVWRIVAFIRSKSECR